MPSTDTMRSRDSAASGAGRHEAGHRWWSSEQRFGALLLLIRADNRRDRSVLHALLRRRSSCPLLLLRMSATRMVASQQKERHLVEGPEIKFAEAVLDNGKFGKRTVRFETGRLAQQAQGAVAAYLDEDTMLLSATSAGKHPRDGFDFFPLTVDVEERSYAAGKIPGSFFRREGRPSTEAILVCRLIDRPLRPTFVEGLRNEVQIVITVLSIAPDEFYDALAINAASLSTQISGLPFYGPVAGIRLALMSGNGAGNDQWIAFPKYSQLEEAVFDLTVAGRLTVDKDGNEDVATMMSEAKAPEGEWALTT